MAACVLHLECVEVSIRAVLCLGSSTHSPKNPSSISYTRVLKACFYLVLIVMWFYLPTPIIWLFFIKVQADINAVLSLKFCNVSSVKVNCG